MVAVTVGTGIRTQAGNPQLEINMHGRIHGHLGHPHLHYIYNLALQDSESHFQLVSFHPFPPSFINLLVNPNVLSCSELAEPRLFLRVL